MKVFERSLTGSMDVRGGGKGGKRKERKSEYSLTLTIEQRRVYAVREIQGKCPFHLGQGMPGKLRVFCNDQRKLALS